VSIRVDKRKALEILTEESVRAEKEGADDKWERLVEKLSAACEEADVRTHIAFLGTALLAKATDLRADVFSVKSKAETPGAYSARGLGHGVLVPNAVKLGIHLGVTGREPLNNQPYFRIRRATLESILPLVRDKAAGPVKVLCEILSELESVSSSEEARRALRSFIVVRRRYRREYPALGELRGAVSVDGLVDMIETLNQDRSEGGKLAQAIATGMMDLFAGYTRTESGRINEPDRHMPGDVGVVSLFDASDWERVIEVRDKGVKEADLFLFCEKLAESPVNKAAVLAVANGQKRFPTEEAERWAREKAGVMLKVFWGWKDFVEQSVFWSSYPETEGVRLAFVKIRKRLYEQEVSARAIEQWDLEWAKRGGGDRGGYNAGV